jgi:dihydroxy-acid dehydratase
MCSTFMSTQLTHILLDILYVTRDILTRNSFLNAIAIVNVIGGSTNAVRRLLLILRMSLDHAT